MVTPDNFSKFTGYETTKGIAKRGATIYVGCKDTRKGQDAVNRIIEETRNPNIKVLKLDLGSFESVREFAENFKKENVPLNVLINNAGVWMGDEVVKSADGFENTFAVNHLGHFLLTNLLQEKLVRSAPSRVVTVSSLLHKRGVVDFDNLNSEKAYNARDAYSNSKLMNILFSNELGRRLAGTGVVTSSLHPGVISTGLHRSMTNPVFTFIYENVWGFLGKDPEHGAQTTITAAIAKEFENKTSVYMGECKEEEPAEAAKDEKLAQKLWALSEKLTKLT